MRTKFWHEDLKGRDHSERPMFGWEDNFRMDIREIGFEVVD
jgi:hypothetical protein